MIWYEVIQLVSYGGGLIIYDTIYMQRKNGRKNRSSIWFCRKIKIILWIKISNKNIIHITISHRTHEHTYKPKPKQNFTRFVKSSHAFTCAPEPTSKPFEFLWDFHHCACSLHLESFTFTAAVHSSRTAAWRVDAGVVLIEWDEMVVLEIK